MRFIDPSTPVNLHDFYPRNVPLSRHFKASCGGQAVNWRGDS
jgi:hypothetical protein